MPPVWEVWKAERKKIKNKNTFDFLKEESVMAKTKIAVLWGVLIAMMAVSYTHLTLPTKLEV